MKRDDRQVLRTICINLNKRKQMKARMNGHAHIETKTNVSSIFEFKTGTDSPTSEVILLLVVDQVGGGGEKW